MHDTYIHTGVRIYRPTYRETYGRQTTKQTDEYAYKQTAIGTFVLIRMCMSGSSDLRLTSPLSMYSRVCATRVCRSRPSTLSVATAERELAWQSRTRQTTTEVPRPARSGPSPAPPCSSFPAFRHSPGLYTITSSVSLRSYWYV